MISAHKKLILTVTALAAVISPPSAAQQAAKAAAPRQLDSPLLYVKRHSYRGIHIYDAFYKWPPGGGGIYIVHNTSDPEDQWKEQAVIDESSANSLGKGLYTHPDVSWDGKKILFCYKGSPDGDTCIYEIGVDGKNLRKVSDPSTVEVEYNGGGSRKGMHDLSPAYLPDGRIVFLSTRAVGLVPCNDSGVTILHVMNADGSDIHTISVNSENEFDPSVLPDGRIIFGRWEYIDKNALTVQSVWTVWPDGSKETAVFASNMSRPEATLDVRAVPGSQLIAVTQARHNSHPRGCVSYIDPALGKNNPEAIFNFNSPGDPVRDTGNSCEPYPLDKDTVLCSGRPAGHEKNVIEIMTRDGGRRTLMSDPAICLHDPMLVKARSKPPVLPTLTDRSQKTGSFFVHDVYQGLEGVKRGEAKWLRVIEETSRVSKSPRSPNPYNQTFLVSGALAFAAKIYHGMVPINEDGSIHFEAPSGRLLYFQVLDQDKRLIRSMRTFIQAAPGTTRSCIGCHENRNETPPVDVARRRPDLSRGPMQLKPESWGTGYMDYPSMIQPIWDKHCVSCHGGEKGFAGRLDLTGGWTTHFSNSYENLIDRRETQLVAHLISGIDCMNGTANYSNRILPPRSHGSATAPLAEVIMSGHDNRLEKMTETERDLIMAWIDSNGLYHGTYNYTKHGYTSGSVHGTHKQLAGEMTKAGCMKCHDKRFARDWINLEQPELSRILRAPLATGKGFGAAICRDHVMDPKRGRIKILHNGYQHAIQPIERWPAVEMPKIQGGGKTHVVFADTSNKHYQAMLKIIEKGRKSTLATPRIDMPGAVVVAGQDRMLVEQDVPGVAPAIYVRQDSSGAARVSWQRTAKNIGLKAELHRGKGKEFALSEDTLIAETLIDHIVDATPYDEDSYYALILKGKQTQSRPTYRSAKTK